MKLVIILIILFLTSVLIGSVIRYGQNSLKNRRKHFDRRVKLLSVIYKAENERRINITNRRKQLARELE